MLLSHAGTVLEGYLIAAKVDRQGKSDELQHYESLSKNTSSEEEKERASKIVSIVKRQYQDDRVPSLSYVVNKIEIAAQFK